MSRVYFHSLHGEAEIHGSERAYLRHLALEPAKSAYGVTADSSDMDMDRADRIMSLIPEPPAGDHGADYLHIYWRAAKAEIDRWEIANKNAAPGVANYVPMDNDIMRRFFKRAEKAVLDRHATFDLNGAVLVPINVALNTALVTGSDEIALAAKLHGYCESHAFVEGPDRAWMADLIQSALDKGIYRRTLREHNQGWESVIELLLSRDDEPVVLSDSSVESFPNNRMVDIPLFDDWKPEWANDEQGQREWAECDEQGKAEAREEAKSDLFHSLSAQEQWDRAMPTLRAGKPWLQISPETLRGTTFSYPVTAWDLMAPDYEERVRRAVEVE